MRFCQKKTTPRWWTVGDGGGGGDHDDDDDDYAVPLCQKNWLCAAGPLPF